VPPRRALAAAAAGGCECHAAFGALVTGIDTTGEPDPTNGADREWPVADKQAAADRLRERKLLKKDGTITATGMKLHVAMERQTDEASALRWEGDERNVERLADLMAEPVALLQPGRAFPRPRNAPSGTTASA